MLQRLQTFFVNRLVIMLPVEVNQLGSLNSDREALFFGVRFNRIDEIVKRREVSDPKEILEEVVMPWWS